MVDRGEGALRNDLYRLLMLLRGGGSIVSSFDCKQDEITIATVERRVFWDKDGFGYVFRPKEVRTP